VEVTGHWLATGRASATKAAWNVLSPLLFLLVSCLRRTQLDGVKHDVLRGRVKRKLDNPSLPGRIAVKLACMCSISNRFS